MKNILVISAIFISFLTISSCSTTSLQTSYSPQSLKGGYTQTQLGETMWKVTVNGNGFTSEETVYEYAMLRAAEITLNKGYEFFVVASENADTRTNYAKFGQYSSNTTGTVSTIGNTSSINANTYYNTPTYIPVKRAKNEIVFEAIEDKNTRPFVYDAKFLYNSLGRKHITNFTPVYEVKRRPDYSDYSYTVSDKAEDKPRSSGYVYTRPNQKEKKRPMVRTNIETLDDGSSQCTYQRGDEEKIISYPPGESCPMALIDE